MNTQGVKNLMDRLGRMKATKPLFVDFTWGAGGSTAELTLDLTLRAKKEHGLVPNMHLTCTNMPVEKIDNALAKCKVGWGKPPPPRCGLGLSVCLKCPVLVLMPIRPLASCV